MILFLFLLLIPGVTCFAGEDEPEKSIAVLPLVNKGDYTYDYISEISQSHLTYYLNLVPGYNSVPTEKVEKYLKKHKIARDDLGELETILKIGEGLEVQQLIESSFYNEKERIIFNFKIIDMASRRVVSDYKFQSSTGIELLDELDNIEVKLVEEITDVLLRLGRLVLKTDVICIVLVDNEPIGTTPLDKPVLIGEHELKLVYDHNGEQVVLYSGPLKVQEEKTVLVEKEMGFPVQIQSDRKSTVYIDGVPKGTTPFTVYLPEGRSYSVKVIYTNSAGEDIEVYARELTEEVRQKIKIKNGLYIEGGNENFQAAVTPGKKRFFPAGTESKPLPAEFLNLKTGDYRVGVFLRDPKWLIKIPILNQTQSIAENDYNHINAVPKWVRNYKKRWYLAFAPSALQFYNHQYVKAGISVTMFSAGILTAGFSFLAGFLYYQYEYLQQVQDWRDQNFFRPETYESIQTSYDNLYALFYGMLFSGLGTALISWIYSVIDGLVTMHRLHYLIYPEERKKPKVSFSLSVVY